MDDDPVLRALGAALERDDPRLAALLGPAPADPPVLACPVPGSPGATPSPTRRRRLPGWIVVLGSMLVAGLLVLAAIPMGLAAFGVIGMVALLASPVVACWWCATADELRPPEG